MKKILSLAFALLVSACQSVPENVEPPRRLYNQGVEGLDTDQFVVYDPLEAGNKQIYKFNALADEYLLLPVSDTYKFIAPEFVRHRITDFFLNISEFGNFTNSILQLKPGDAGITLGRFGVNTTAGLLGTFDVATEIGLERKSQDFGKTLAYYGSSAGPYLMLPVLGPSSVRDTAGFAVDTVTLSLVIPNDVEDSLAYNVAVYGVQPVNQRANNDFRYYESGSAFEYELVRYISSTARQLQVDKNNLEGKVPPKSN